MGMLGALYGLGKGVEDMADRRLKEISDEELFRKKQEAEMAKEKRIEEAAIRAEQRGEDRTIRAEERGLENEERSRQSQFDFENNPDNVARRNETDIARQRAKDEYSDSRFDTVLEQEGALARARHIDNTDYKARKLAHRLAEIQIKQAENSRAVPDAVKTQVKSWGERAKAITDSIDKGLLKEKELLAAKIERSKLYHNIDQALSQYSGLNINENPDPFGIRGKLGPEGDNKQDETKDEPDTGKGLLSQPKKKIDPRKIRREQEKELPELLQPKGKVASRVSRRDSHSLEARAERLLTRGKTGNRVTDSKIEAIRKDQTLTREEKIAKIIEVLN